MSQDSEWLDFPEIKDNADVRYILTRLGLMDQLTQTGNEIKGWCPLGTEHGKDDSFSVNADNKKYQCFACKKKGDIIRLVQVMLNLDGARPAAKWIKDEMKKSALGDVTEAVEAPQRATQVHSTEDMSEALTHENANYTVAVMTFGEACRKIKYSGLDSDYLRVVDIRQLQMVKSDEGTAGDVVDQYAH